MRIAQIAPLHESVPPREYGGTERVVHFLTEELVRQGHEVTLFASADSQTAAELVSASPESLRNANGRRRTDTLAWHLIELEQVASRWGEFDVLHFHVGHLHFPLARRSPVPTVTTLHGRLDLPELAPLFAEYSELPLVSISDAQRAPLPDRNWRRTIHHGLPLDLHRPSTGRGEYLAFLGRISSEKRVDRAIEIAQRAGWPLRIAAKVDPSDQEYFESTIEPLLGQPGIEYIGEIGEDAKSEFLGGAHALLFPIDWPEPFGLVMTEAMACGTPVIATARGSVPEVIEDGVTGWIVSVESYVEEGAERLRRLDEIDPHACRERVQRLFSKEAMVAVYERVFERVVADAAGGRTGG